MRFRIAVLCVLALLAGCANPLDSGRDDPGCCTAPPNTDPPPPKG